MPDAVYTTVPAGIYTSGNLMVDIGGNTMPLANGQVGVLNNATVNAQGYLQCVDYDSSSSTITATIKWTGLATSSSDWAVDLSRRTTATWDTVSSGQAGMLASSSWNITRDFPYYITGTTVQVYNWDASTPFAEWPIKKPEDRLREIIRSRIAPKVLGKDRALKTECNIREERARDTLRRVIGEVKYRDYQKKGFITVRGKSGLAYQISPSHTTTKVWNKGMMVEDLCVVLSGDFPPTDSLIMRYLMILNNEEHFRSLAVKRSVSKQRIRLAQQAPERSLTEIFAGFKGKVA